MRATTTRRRGGKRGELTDGALSDEVLDSSPSVLHAGRGGAMRGLQQFYSPPEAAELIAAVNWRELATLDPTAGDGALLARVAEEARFGIEIDPDQVAAGGYRAITGDLQRAYPLLRVLGARVARIAANPPFGLTWSSGAGRRESSTVATWRMCQGLLSHRAAGRLSPGAIAFYATWHPAATPLASTRSSSAPTCSMAWRCRA